MARRSLRLLFLIASLVLVATAASATVAQSCIGSCVPPNVTRVPRPPFPLPPLGFGPVGEDLPAPEWEGFNIGGAVCPNWVAYHSDQTGDWDVYRLGSTGGTDESNNLSQGPNSADIQPSRSADSEWIVFSSNRDGLVNWELWLGKADGSEQRRISYNTGVDINPSWGPGNKIAFESNRDGNWEIYTFDVSTGELVRVTESDSNDINPTWGPDGNTLYFLSDRNGDWDVFSTDLTTGETTQLTEAGDVDLAPAISNDGTKMAWLKRDNAGVFNLWLMDLETGSTQQLSDLGASLGNPIFSPDDTVIAFDARVGGIYDVFGVNATNGAVENITNTPGDDRAPSFRCSTSALVYQTQQADGSWDLFQVNPIPIEPTGSVNVPNRLTNTPNNEFYPMNVPSDEDYSREGRLPS